MYEEFGLYMTLIFAIAIYNLKLAMYSVMTENHEKMWPRWRI